MFLKPCFVPGEGGGKAISFEKPSEFFSRKIVLVGKNSAVKFLAVFERP